MVRNLWSPWRMKYLMEAPPEGCIFCALAAPGEEERKQVLLRARHHYVILNIYPYTVGHVMLVSNRHVARPSDLSAEERREAAELTLRIERAVGSVYGASGANVGFNLGRCAGAGVEGHLHLHFVPRREGDLEAPADRASDDPSEPLEASFRRLRAALASSEA